VRILNSLFRGNALTRGGYVRARDTRANAGRVATDTVGTEPRFAINAGFTAKANGLLAARPVLAGSTGGALSVVGAFREAHGGDLVAREGRTVLAWGSNAGSGFTLFCTNDLRALTRSASTRRVVWVLATTTAAIASAVVATGADVGFLARAGF
jgi:hypothetical protein